MTSKWNYLSRTMPGIGPQFLPLEETISSLLHSQEDHHRMTPKETFLLYLPDWVSIPTQATDSEFLLSTKITEALKGAILQQNFQYTEEVIALQLEAKSDVHKLRREQAKQESDLLKGKVPPSLQSSMVLAQEKGASSWLTTLPIEEFGFALHKGTFQDALALRYNWQPQHVPSTCACGTKFSVEHALSCPKGGFPSIRHNESGIQPSTS